MHGLKWYSPSIGVMLLGICGAIYLFGELIETTFGFTRSYSFRFDTRAQAILLAEYKEAIVWKFPATSNKIRVDGCGSSSIRNVRGLVFDIPNLMD
jgi:hypothetical protein